MFQTRFCRGRVVREVTVHFLILADITRAFVFAILNTTRAIQIRDISYESTLFQMPLLS